MFELCWLSRFDGRISFFLFSSLSLSLSLSLFLLWCFIIIIILISGHAIGHFCVASGRNAVDYASLHVMNSSRPSLFSHCYSIQCLVDGWHQQAIRLSSWTKMGLKVDRIEINPCLGGKIPHGIQRQTVNPSRLNCPWDWYRHSTTILSRLKILFAIFNTIPFGMAIAISERDDWLARCGEEEGEREGREGGCYGDAVPHTFAVSIVARSKWNKIERINRNEIIRMIIMIMFVFCLFF